MISLLIAATLLCGVLGTPADDSRIIGGEDAMPGEFPFIVSLRIKNRHICGGSILDESNILTAAHCMFQWEKYPTDYSIQYGILQLKQPFNVISVVNMTRHENYVEGGGYDNDVAILQLAAPILLSKRVAPVELPAATDVPQGTAVLAGWGSSEVGGGNTPRLQRADLDVIDDEVCVRNEWLYDPKFHMCAGKLDGSRAQCSGDSGGPLLVRGKQFGIVSWSEKPCGTPGHAGVHTKVVNYLQWIGQHLYK